MINNNLGTINSLNCFDSENKYKTIFENSAVAITLTDEHEKIIGWNKYAETLLNKTHDDLYLKPVAELYPVEEWEKIRRENIRQKGMQHHLETKILRKNQEPLDVDISLSVLKNNEGNIIGSIGVIKDISKQKKAQQRLSSLLEYSTDSIYLVDYEGKYLLVNNELLSRLELSKEEVIGKTIANLHSPEETQEFLHKIHSVYVQKKPVKDEHKNERTDRCFLRTLSPVFDDLTVDVTAVAIISKDITDWKKTEEKLIFEHSLLQDLLDHIPDSIYFKDIENRFILVNKAKASHHNLQPSEMIGKTDYDFLQEHQAQKSFEDDNKIIQTGEPIIAGTEKVTKENGETKYVSVTKLPRYDSTGNIIGTMGISRDISKQVKEMKETEKYKKVAIGQNLRMIELRDKVKELISEMENEKK